MSARAGLRHIGLSEVSVDEVRAAQLSAEIGTVQNQYNLGYRVWETEPELCEREGIGFIPWFPAGTASWPARTAPSPAWPSTWG